MTEIDRRQFLQGAAGAVVAAVLPWLMLGRDELEQHITSGWFQVPAGDGQWLIYTVNTGEVQRFETSPFAAVDTWPDVTKHYYQQYRYKPE